MGQACNDISCSRTLLLSWPVAWLFFTGGSVPVQLLRFAPTLSETCFQTATQQSRPG